MKQHKLMVNNSPQNDNFKPIDISINRMTKFQERKTMKQRNVAKTTCYDWYDWLINYILEPMKKLWMVLKTKF